MKTRLLILTFCYLALTSCNYPDKTQVPEDFEIIIWSEPFGQVEVMSGALYRNVDGIDHQVKFHLSSKEKLEIYNSLSSAGLLELKSDYQPKPHCGGMHQSFYEIKILQGDTVRNINLSNCDYSFFEGMSVKKYLNAIQPTFLIVRNKPEVLNIPKSQNIVM